MPTDEHARSNLFVRLEQTIGTEAASTLMERLRPVPWDQLVTKDYLDQRLESLKYEIFATMREDLHVQTKTLLIGIIGTSLAYGSMIVAAAKFA
jgi:hypothetical protein